MDLHVFPIPIPPPTSLTIHPTPLGHPQCTSPEQLSQASMLGWGLMYVHYPFCLFFVNVCKWRVKSLCNTTSEGTEPELHGHARAPLARTAES